MTSNRFGWRSGKVHAKAAKVDDHRILEAIWIPANQLSLQTSGTAATAGQIDDVPVTIHSSIADDQANFSLLVPDQLSDGGKMEVTVYWNSADTEGGTVHWDIDYRSTADGEDTGAGIATNITTGVQTDNSTANIMNVSSTMEVPASDLSAGDVFHGTLFNDNSEGTLNDDARVIGLKVRFIDPLN